MAEGRRKVETEGEGYERPYHIVKEVIIMVYIIKKRRRFEVVRIVVLKVVWESTDLSRRSTIGLRRTLVLGC